MAIKTKKRAEVAQEFQDIYREMAEQVLRQAHERLMSTHKDMRAKALRQSRGLFARLTPITRGYSAPGAGLDLEVSRLRALDYERLFVEAYKGKPYLVGETPELLAEGIGGYHHDTQWDIGPYRIYVPVADIGRGSLNGIHFVPLRDPQAEKRHLHHYATGDGHYLGMSPRTCWSQFASPGVGVLREANLSELFRLLRIFVGRFYFGSPLVRVETITFARQV